MVLTATSGAREQTRTATKPEKTNTEKPAAARGSSTTESVATRSAESAPAQRPTRATSDTARTATRLGEDRMRAHLLRTTAQTGGTGPTGGTPPPISEERRAELDRQAEELSYQATHGNGAQAANTLAQDLATLPQAEGDYLTAQLAKNYPRATAEILRHTYPDPALGGGSPTAQQRLIPQALGRLYDNGTIGRADIDRILSPINSVPFGMAVPPDPRRAAQVLADSGSDRLRTAAASSLLLQSQKAFGDGRNNYHEAALALGPKAMIDAFGASPALMDNFFRDATSANQLRLLQGVNQFQNASRPYSGAPFYTISNERFRTMDEIWKRAVGEGDPALRPALDTYLRANVSRPAFLDKAILDDLRSGRADDTFRTELYESFRALSVADSHRVMEAIRNDGLLDEYLTAVLRDDTGGPVDPLLFDGIQRMMETGRLDAYAETLASTTFNIHDPAVTGRSSDHHFNSGDNAIYFNQNIDPIKNGDVEGLARTLAHETYHAFQAAHGGASGALNEGMGIAAIHYAFSNGDYSIAEAVYGTKNFYRDKKKDPNPDYPLGTFENADPKLLELLGMFGSRDTSDVAWQNPAQLEQEYTDYWEQYHRFEDLDGNGVSDWAQAGGYAEQAEAAMLAGRAAP